MEAIELVGLIVATDQGGNSCEKMAPFLNKSLHVRKNDSFVAAIPSPEVHITCGIDFPQVYIPRLC